MLCTASSPFIKITASGFDYDYQDITKPFYTDKKIIFITSDLDFVSLVQVDEVQVEEEN